MTTQEAQVQVTWRAQEALESLNYTAEEMVTRHNEENSEKNGDSHYVLAEQGPIISSYRLNGTTVIWVITASDRKTIAVLLPSDSATYRKLL